MNTLKQFTIRQALASAFILFLFTAFLCAPAGEAWAASKPQWLATKMVECKIIRNTKITNMAQEGYYEVFARIQHTNNSSDKIVTALFDKTGSITMTGSSSKVNSNTGAVINHVITVPLRSTRVNKLEVYPGQSQILQYNLPIKKIGNHTMADINDDIRIYGKSYKLSKWDYDLKVRSQGF